MVSNTTGAQGKTMTQQQSWPNLQEDDFVLSDFHFGSGEVLDRLTLHYRTMGTAMRDRDGAIANAALLIHNTTGSGETWLSPGLADDLFGDGQPRVFSNTG